MSTTGSRFVAASQGVPITSANAATGNVGAYSPSITNQLAGGGAGTIIDSLVDLSKAGFAKNGAFFLNLAASTPVTIDATAIASAATASAGDNSFATANSIELINLGLHDVKVGAAASNPMLLGLGGTTPTLTVPAGSRVVIGSVAGFSTSGANNLKVDPGANACQLAAAIGGS